MSIKPSLKLFKRAGVINSAFPEYLTSITPGLVSLWIPGEDGRAIDIIGQNHGTVHGANRNIEVYPNQIRNDLGWSGDGVDDSISIPELVLSGEYTIFGWVRREDASATSPIFGHSTGTGFVGFKSGVNKFRVIAKDGGSADESVSAEQGERLFFCVTRDTNNKVDLYINSGSANRLFSDAAQSGNLTLNRIFRSGTDYMKGSGWLLGVCNQALSSAQVANLYQATKDLVKRGNNYVEFTANMTSLETITFKFTVDSRYSVTIDWGDGSETVCTGGPLIAYDHNYASTGTYNIKIYGDLNAVTKLRCDNAKISGDIGTLSILVNLVYLNLGGTSVFGDIANLPREQTGDLLLGGTSVFGDIANLPDGLVKGIYLNSTSVSGDIADLPSGITENIYLQFTSVSAYTATSWPCNTQNNMTIDFRGLGLSQSECDDILCHLDTYGATNGTLKLTGNSVPSAVGLNAKTNLEAKGWTVEVDT